MLNTHGAGVSSVYAPTAPTVNTNECLPRKKSYGNAIKFYRLLLRLSRRIDRTTKKSRGYAFAHAEWYADQMRVTARTIRNYLAWLREEGFIWTDEEIGKRIYIYPLVAGHAIPSLSDYSPRPKNALPSPEVSALNAEAVSGVYPITPVTTGRQQPIRKGSGDTKPSTVDAAPVVVSSMDIKPMPSQEEDATIALLVTETVPVSVARDLVRKYGADKCRRQIANLRFVKEFRSGRVGWLRAALAYKEGEGYDYGQKATKGQGTPPARSYPATGKPNERELKPSGNVPDTSTAHDRAMSFVRENESPDITEMRRKMRLYKNA